MTAATERVEDQLVSLNSTAARIANALERLAEQHYAASSAEHGPLFHTLLSEEDPA